MANLGWTGGKCEPGNMAGHADGGVGASTADLSAVFKGTTANQPNVGENRGAGGTGSSGSKSQSS